MDDKEQISTLIGADLPPVNPYLDDDADDDADNDTGSKGKTKSKKPAVPVSGSTKSIAPDPKEYIAELERPEDVDILY